MDQLTALELEPSDAMEIVALELRRRLLDSFEAGPTMHRQAVADAASEPRRRLHA